MAVNDDKRAQEQGQELLRCMNAQFPDFASIDWLVTNGASMGVTDREGLTPLLRAMTWGNKSVIQNMVRRGADVNYAGGKAGVTAMQIAAASGDLELVAFMVQAGGDILQRNKAGISALDAAHRNPNPGVLEFVEEAARPLLAARDAAERHAKAISDGVPVEKPFSPLKPLRFRPR